MKRNKSFREKKPDMLLLSIESKPITDQIIEIAPYVRTYFSVTI